MTEEKVLEAIDRAGCRPSVKGMIETLSPVCQDY